jgi:hypothetical protein
VSQAGILVLSPILVEVAREFGVSTATVGQLRMVTGLVAGSGALLLGRLAGRARFFRAPQRTPELVEESESREEQRVTVRARLDAQRKRLHAPNAVDARKLAGPND